MQQSPITEIKLSKSKNLQFTHIDDLVNEKPKRIRSQLQLQNDLVLGERLKKYHSDKKRAKESTINMTDLLAKFEEQKQNIIINSDPNYKIQDEIDIFENELIEKRNFQELINDSHQKELDEIFIINNAQQLIDESIQQALDIIIDINDLSDAFVDDDEYIPDDIISKPKRKGRGRPKKVINPIVQQQSQHLHDQTA